MSEQETARRPEVAGLIAVLGADVTRFESLVYHLASQLTVDEPAEHLRRYQGGSWALLTVATDVGPAWWWRLQADDRFRFSNPGNGSEAMVDAELLSLAVNLIALSHLCIYHYQRHHSALNQAYARLHEALKQYCFSHLEADEQRLGVFLAMID